MDPSQLPPRMSSPGEILHELVKKYDINKSELGRRVGKNYTTVNQWTKGVYFNDENQQAVLRALREMVREGELRISEALSDDFFTASAEKTREAFNEHRASIIKFFEADTKIGRTLQEDERKKLWMLDQSIVLDVALCQALVLSMRKTLRSDPFEAAAKNRAARSESGKTKGSKRE